MTTRLSDTLYAVGVAGRCLLALLRFAAGWALDRASDHLDGLFVGMCVVTVGAGLVVILAVITLLAGGR
jgi:hypothetical protein